MTLAFYQERWIRRSQIEAVLMLLGTHANRLQEVSVQYHSTQSKEGLD
jgi:NADH:ubiquinone oxidoreductase subunit E